LEAKRPLKEDDESSVGPGKKFLENIAFPVEGDWVGGL
jgi:hypothetical protein